MGLALVGILCYYPFATFLYSNLQFVNKINDIKFHSQFIVYFVQVKFIFVALNTFLRSTPALVIIRLIIMGGLMLLLAVHSIRTVPCLVQSVNHIFSISSLNISYVSISMILAISNYNFSRCRSLNIHCAGFNVPGNCYNLDSSRITTFL